MISGFSVFGASPAILGQHRDGLLDHLRSATQTARQALYGAE
jgi:IclR family pca regulon transcriptional regulator